MRKMEKIKQLLCLREGLENELEDIRSQIKEKTLRLDSSDLTITNMCKGSAPSAQRHSRARLVGLIFKIDWFCFQPLI